MKTISKLLIVIMTVGLLTACGSNYKVDVDLTPEEIQAAKAEIAQMKEDIKNWEGPEGEIPWRQIIKQAEAYNKLGERGKAIDLYKSWLDQGYKTKAIINNLGRLYDDVGEYDLAVEQYQRIVDEYIDLNYYYDITWAYIRAKKRKEAEAAFNKWQLAHQKTDEQTQQAIKKLREEEKKS